MSTSRVRRLRTALGSLVAAGALTLPLALSAAPAQAAPTDDWLHVQGSTIVDASGKEVWLTGVNWFGFNATERVFHGLWSANMRTLTRDIAARGLNVVRVPISTQLLLEWKAGTFTKPNVNEFANPELAGLNSLQVFETWLDMCEEYGIKVFLDVHSAEADNSGHVYPTWWKGDITTEKVYEGWEWAATRWKNDDTIIGADIKNEPHGTQGDTERAKWDGSTDKDNFKHFAETASRKVLAINPNWLVFIEGIEIYPKPGVSWSSKGLTDYYGTWWGGNLRGVRDFPIDLGANQDQLVYSPHDYGPLVYEQPWFTGDFDRASLERDVWDPNWLYLHKEGIAPLLIGEWGGFMDGGKNEKWMLALRDLIVDRRLSHTFWVLNPNSGDTGGLLGYDWATWDEEKYALLEPALWQQGGKFVGLDHDVPLGGAGSTTGISLSQATGTGATPTPSVTPTVRPTLTPTPTPTPSASVSPGPTATPTAPPTAGPTPTTPPTGACTVTYSASSWSTGLSGAVRLTNTGSTLSGWTLTFTAPAGVTVTQGWGGTWSQSGTAVTVTNATWNGALAAGGTAEIGFNASHGGTAGTPTGFALNGARCVVG
ncbi:cellulase family glycosylhydrolase [Cellulomonas sp. KH9]|uniref:cellulase family glycosylhydrolase n=1 Tax=Cellulomonas sp. KH9 TaxID=1855324 RepID=UPI0008EB4522|nr:cellulase family glycosylhydrolase [Cellulomonas sp. KH9]SFJ98004.1 Aryl-phospho-beta-D-glucosidase BglC, GH1 family [Cellulomonas sp. KH9]